MNIILGGTSGLGKEIAEQFREQDKRTLVLGSSYSIEKDREGFRVDLGDEQSVDECVTALSSQLGSQALDSFWWVSGYGYNGDFSQQENARKMAVVNFAGALPLVQFVWQRLLEQDQGTLAVVSSTTGVRTRADEAVYAATKHAQVGFTRSLGSEAERLKSGTKIALFLPGGMRTSFWNDEDRPDVYDSFNNPKKVAEVMLDTVNHQNDTFIEQMIERGELT